MPNPFDALQDSLFDKVKKIFGYTATWTPSSGGTQKVTDVLFREPSEQEKVINNGYYPNEYYAEFRKGDDFSTPLFEAVRDGLVESISITIQSNLRTFRVMQITAAYDGRTYKARLEET